MTVNVYFLKEKHGGLWIIYLWLRVWLPFCCGEWHQGPQQDPSRTRSWKNPGLLETGAGPAPWGTPESLLTRALPGC